MIVRLKVTTPIEILHNDPPFQASADAELNDGSRVALSQTKCRPTWSSSEPEVAKVSATGLVQPSGLGSAGILVTCEARSDLRGESKLRVGYKVAGVVHEAAPTEAVPVPGALVSVEGGELNGQSVSTDDAGRFALPLQTTAGIALRVNKPEYEASRHDVLMVPRDEHPLIALLPSNRILTDTWHEPCVGDPSTPLGGCSGRFGREVTFSFPIHHSGALKVIAGLCVRGCLSSEWAYATCVDVRNDHGTLLAQFKAAGRLGYDVGLNESIDVPGGHRYDVTLKVCDGFTIGSESQFNIVAYDLLVSRPN
jgi:hypothetical protein